MEVAQPLMQAPKAPQINQDWLRKQCARVAEHQINGGSSKRLGGIMMLIGVPLLFAFGVGLIPVVFGLIGYSRGRARLEKALDIEGQIQMNVPQEMYESALAAAKKSGVRNESKRALLGLLAIVVGFLAILAVAIIAG